MPYNKDFYGENGMRVFTGSNLSGYTRYVQGMRCANFNNANSPNETSGRLATAAAQGITEVGAMPDLSICTHGIAAVGQWNTLWDSGAFDYVGRPGDNMYKPDKGPTMPVSWIFHQLNDMSYSQGYCARRTSLENVFWGPDKVDPRDGLSAQMITEMDFKGIIAIPLIQVSSNTVQSERDAYGRYVLNNSWRPCYWLSLDEYVNGSYTGSDDQTYYWWDQYQMVHGVGYIVFRTNLADNDNQWTILDPYYDWIHNNVSAFPLEMGKWSCDASATQPSDGSIKTTGIDFCSPVVTANGITIRIKYDMDADRRSHSYSTSPIGGNIPMILGGTVNNSGMRQRSGSEGFFDGVSFVHGFSHLNTVMIASGVDNQFYIWDDRPTSKTEFVNAVHTMMSYLCIPFADDLDLIDTTRPKYIGILDDAGIATGRYEVIENIDDYVQLASDDFINDNTYDPTYDPTRDIDDPYVFPSNPSTGYAAFERVYALTRSDVDDLNEWLQDCTKYSLHPPEGTTDPEKLLEDYKNAAYGEAPINGIVSLMVFPTISLPLILGSTGRHWIHVGTLLTNDIMGMSIEGMHTVQGYKISSETGLFVFNRGTMSIPWPPYFNDFRDYAPYTSAELVVPFHGSVQLDPADWLGHTIDVAFIVDFRTGASTALICRDGVPILSLDGNLGIQIPLHATDAANAINTVISNAFQVRSAELQKQTAIADAITGTIAGATSSAAGVRKVAANLDANAASMGAGLIAAGTPLVSAATKGIQGIRSADLNLSKAKQEMNHIPVTRMSVGSASTTVSFGAERYLRLNIHRPKMAPGYNPEIYGHTVGFACNMFGNVSDFHGYTECGDIDCSGIAGATEEEKNMIHDAMVSGTYL